MQFGKSALAIVAAFAVQSTYADTIYDIASGNDSFSTLTAAVDAAGLTEVLQGDGTYTVFAPPNDAFAALPEGAVDKLLQPEWVFHLQDVLKYHTLGSDVMSTDLSDGMTAETLNTEEITINLDPARVNEVSNILVSDGLVDIEADNGVIHAVDNVLLPTSVTSSIVDIAAGNADFSTLVAAVEAAGLVDALSGDDPLTVFAPTNAAFDALPEGTLDTLLLPENKQMLTDILTYHVVGANAHSSTLTDGPVETLNGATVEISMDTEGVMVNDAKVVAADILANNGIIHVIDKVILPMEEGTASAPTDMDEGAPTPMDEDPTSGSAAKVLSIGAVAAGLTAMLF